MHTRYSASHSCTPFALRAYSRTSDRQALFRWCLSNQLKSLTKESERDLARKAPAVVHEIWRTGWGRVTMKELMMAGGKREKKVKMDQNRTKCTIVNLNVNYKSSTYGRTYALRHACVRLLYLLLFGEVWRELYLFTIAWKLSDRQNCEVDPALIYAFSNKSS